MNVVIGTAGHIDHGKSALVAALTGIQTDRLPEEQERGISIELGFAYLDLADGTRVGLVDVPGHERFIRQMLAGAQGFDLMLMVVAADDGVMPQTEEHFEICHLLGVRRGMFVITKTDLVDDARVEDVRAEIEILALDTAFEEAPIFAVSAQTGDGIEGLRAALSGAVEELRSAEGGAGSGPFRMPVDRSFVIKGHGTVVTGTASGGSISPGDDVEILPGGARARVREIQVHEQPVERAHYGQRVALNLSGVERDEVERGSSVVTPDLGATTSRFDATVEVRPSAGKPVDSHTRVRVHVGTAEVDGRLIWIDGRESVAPKERAYAQLALREDMVAFTGDRFVLRDETASRTLGGGSILVARARKHRTRDGEISPTLRAIETGTLEERLVAFSETTDGLGPTPAGLALAVGASAEDVLARARENEHLVLLPDSNAPLFVVSKARYERFVEELIERTERFHADNPKAPGIELESLRQACSFDVDTRTFRTIVDDFVGPDRLTRSGSVVAVAGHSVSMSADEEALASRILSVVIDKPTTPPSLKELRAAVGVEEKRLGEFIRVLCDRGDLVKVSSELVFATGVVRDAEAKLRGYLESNERITAAEFRDLISASRKYSIPLLDYFDRSGVTVRSGDYRRLRG